jgi:hypothetical protein
MGASTGTAALAVLIRPGTFAVTRPEIRGSTSPRIPIIAIQDDFCGMPGSMSNGASADALTATMSAMPHKRTFHMLIRHVRFSAEAKHCDVII